MYEHPGDTGGHKTGHHPADHRAQSQGGEVTALIGCQHRDTADLNTHGSKIRETA